MHAFADCTLARPVLFRHRLIHDHHRGCVVTIVHRKGPPTQQGDVHGLKVIAISRSKQGKLKLPRGSRLTFNRVRGCSVEFRRQRSCYAGSHNARLGGETFYHVFVKGIDRIVRRVLLLRQLVRGDQHVSRTEAGIDRAHRLEAAQKSP